MELAHQKNSATDINISVAILSLIYGTSRNCHAQTEKNNGYCTLCPKFLLISVTALKFAAQFQRNNNYCSLCHKLDT